MSKKLDINKKKTKRNETKLMMLKDDFRGHHLTITFFTLIVVHKSERYCLS